MRVVSDADVIIHLSNLKKLSLLKSLYDKVAIPEYVKSEILVKETPEIKRAFNSFIAVFPTSKTKAKDISRKHNIHTGEAHVKLLGEDLKAKLFLSNERKVRRAAKEEGFSVVGTIGVILRAMKNSLIDMSEAASLLEKMKAEEFRIHPDILQKAISAIKEL